MTIAFLWVGNIFMSAYAGNVNIYSFNIAIMLQHNKQNALASSSVTK